MKRALTRRQSGWLIVAVLAGLAVLPNLVAGIVRYTVEDRSGCVACHEKHSAPWIVEPAPLHRESIGCAECHETQSRERASSEEFSADGLQVSANCVRCHTPVFEGEGLDGEVRVESAEDSTGERSVLFRWPLRDLMWTWHVAADNSACTDCHRTIAHDRPGPDAFRPRIEECVKCHYHASGDIYMMADPPPRLVREREGEGEDGTI